MWKSTIRKAALPLKPSSTSKCSFPLLVRSAVMAIFIGQFSTIQASRLSLCVFCSDGCFSERGYGSCDDRSQGCDDGAREVKTKLAILHVSPNGTHLDPSIPF